MTQPVGAARAELEQAKMRVAAVERIGKIWIIRLLLWLSRLF